MIGIYIQCTAILPHFRQCWYSMVLFKRMRKLSNCFHKSLKEICNFWCILDNNISILTVNKIPITTYKYVYIYTCFTREKSTHLKLAPLNINVSSYIYIFICCKPTTSLKRGGRTYCVKNRFSGVLYKLIFTFPAVFCSNGASIPAEDCGWPLYIQCK